VCIKPSCVIRGAQWSQIGWRLCRKLLFSAHVQVFRRDHRAAAEDRTGGVQKTLVCCTQCPSDEV
jgi:hypothetical protein